MGYLVQRSTIAVPGRLKAESILDADRALDIDVHYEVIRLIGSSSISTVAHTIIPNLVRVFTEIRRQDTQCKWKMEMRTTPVSVGQSQPDNC